LVAMLVRLKGGGRLATEMDFLSIPSFQDFRVFVR
jgi:hypothetical protein